MADFCFQCGVVEMGWPYSDFDYLGKDGVITAEDVAQGMGVLVLCEGCGPTYVDHHGHCLGGCDSRWCRDEAKNLPEVPRRAWEWVQRRAGRLGWVYRSWDWWAGTPWWPGQWHELKRRWHEWRTGDEDDFLSIKPYNANWEGIDDVIAKSVGAGTGDEDHRSAEGQKSEKDGSDPAGLPRREA